MSQCYLKDRDYDTVASIGTMRVLVTGASGFIGGHVLRLLTAAGNDVIGFDITDLGPAATSVHDEIRLIHGDVTDPVDVYNAIAATNPERIIHLASLLVLLMYSVSTDI